MIVIECPIKVCFDVLFEFLREISQIPPYQTRLCPIRWRDTGIRRNSYSYLLSRRCPRSPRTRPDPSGSGSRNRCTTHPNGSSRELSHAEHRDPDAGISHSSSLCPIRPREFSARAAVSCFTRRIVRNLLVRDQGEGGQQADALK